MIVFLIAILLSSFTVSVVMAPTNLSLGEVFASSFRGVVSFLRELPGLIADLRRSSDDKDDWTGVIAFGVIIAFCGTVFTSFVSILIITTLNLAYGFRLGILKTHVFMRKRIGLDESAILKDPIRYIFAVMAIVVLLVTLMGLTLTGGLWAIAYRQ